MKETINRILDRIEEENNIKIIYAVESGSRAWGFASPDSDYDVRYIYVRPVDDYLRIDQPKDTIEGPLDEVLDFSGWDIRKMLSLLRKTNPSLMEWAGSPVVYRTGPAWEALAARFPEFFSPVSNMHHYLSMAVSNWEANMKGKQVKLKKYLYVLRPLLCCRWLEERGTVPPVAFSELRGCMLPQELDGVMDELLRRKQAAGESEITAHIPELDGFILEEISRIRQVLAQLPRAELPGYETLNQMFLETLRLKYPETSEEY